MQITALEINKIQSLQTLPVGEKNHQFNCQKLEYRIKRLKMLFGGTVEHEQCIESQRDADVVDDCNVQITTHWTTQSTTVKSIGTKIFVFKTKSNIHSTWFVYNIEVRWDSCSISCQITKWRKI